MGLPEDFCNKCGEPVLVKKLDDGKEELKKQLVKTRRRGKKLAVDCLHLRSERDRLDRLKQTLAQLDSSLRVLLGA